LTVIETIGYGGKTPDEFFHDLSQLQPDLIIDVRDNPFWRQGPSLGRMSLDE